MSADRLPDITRRLQEWKDRPSAASNIAHGFDRLASWAFTAEDDIEWLITEVEELRRNLRMYEVVKS